MSQFQNCFSYSYIYSIYSMMDQKITFYSIYSMMEQNITLKRKSCYKLPLNTGIQYRDNAEYFGTKSSACWSLMLTKLILGWKICHVKIKICIFLNTALLHNKPLVIIQMFANLTIRPNACLVKCLHVLTTTMVDWETKHAKILFIWQKEQKKFHLLYFIQKLPTVNILTNKYL